MHHRHIGATALLGSLHGMILQAILANAFRICKITLHRQDLRRAHLCGFFDDEIRARLFDGREDQPQIRRQLHRLGLAFTKQDAIAFASLHHTPQPLTVVTVEQFKNLAHAFAHHTEKVMRLLAAQRNRLPRPQRVIYIESNN